MIRLRSKSVTLVVSIAVLLLLCIQFPTIALASEYYAIQGVGVNLSGLEYPWAPYPKPQEFEKLRDKGVGFIRLPVAWERFQPKLHEGLDKLEITKLLSLLDIINRADIKVIIDIHNGGRFDPNWRREDKPREHPHLYVLGSHELPLHKFSEFWKMFAQEIMNHPAIIGYGLMNEPHDLPTPTTWAEAAQMAINAIRTADKATPVYVSGYGWGYDWVKNNGSEPFVNDPSDRVIYELHIYFDKGGGRYTNTYEQAQATPTKGAELASKFSEWLKAKGAKGFIGEFAIPDDDVRWLLVLDNFLKHLQNNGIPSTYWMATYRGAYWFYPPLHIEQKRRTKNYRNRRYKDTFNISLVHFLDEDGVEREKVQWTILKKYMPGTLRKK